MSFSNVVEAVNQNVVSPAPTSDVTPPQPEFISPHAIAAAKRGRRVFPIVRGTKKDCLTRWVHGGPGQKATSDLDQINKWAIRWGSPLNWGKVQGEGEVTVDVDGPEANEYARKMGWTLTRCIKSGSATKKDAYHYELKVPPGFKSKCSSSKLFPGLDIKGDGGMVLLPGSQHPDGPLYEVLVDIEPQMAPQSLLDLIKADEELPAVDLSDMEPLTAAQKQLALDGIDRECRAYAKVVNGQWHAKLRDLAYHTGQRIVRGVLTEEEAWSKIMAIPTVITYFEEKPREVEQKIQSGFVRGANKPYDPTRDEEYQQQKVNAVGFGQAELPAGVSKVPLAPAVAASVPEVFERGLPKLAQKTEVMPFPTHLLGPVLQQAAEAIARRVDCVPDIAAHSVLSGAALAVCPHYDVRLVYGQVRPTSLFLISVGRSGDRKTSADSEAMVAVGMREKELRLRYKRDKPAYDAAMERWEKAYKKHLEDPGYPATPAPVEPKRPTSPVVRCDDPTAEGLRDSFLRGSQVLGLYGDEGAKFLGGHSMKEEHRLNCIGSLSTMWDGSEIRKMRAGNEVDSTSGYRLAAHLMMQPGIAESFLGNALYQEQGILARFLVSWADLESLDGKRMYKEPDPNYDNIMEPYKSRVYQLLSTRLPEDEWGELAPLTVHFSPGAKALWIKYQNESQVWMKPRGKWKPIRAFGEKALEHAARLAVVLQQFNSCSLELSAEYFEAGWQLVLYYASQLLATQSVGNDPELVKAHLLYQWIEDKHEGELVDFRTLRTNGPKSLRDKKVLEPIINVLREHGLLEPVGTVNNRWKIHRGL